MKFDKEVLPYLNGEKFSDGLLIQTVDKVTNPTGRLDFLCDLTENRKVIHVGFADHIPLIKGKIRNNMWLHKRLVERAKLCIGLDIDGEAVNYVNSNWSYQNLFCTDIIKDELLPVVKENAWDYMVLGEILEHVDNPIFFLEQILKKYKPYVKELVITVPNAFDLINLRKIFSHKEFINTDHRYWFTPYTLAKNAMQAGYKVSEFHYVQTYMPNGFIWKILVRKYPMIRETIVMIVEL